MVRIMSGNDLRQRAFDFSPYENEGLFADNYLEHRLEAQDEWQEPDGLEETLSEITTLFEEHASYFTSDTNEAQTEADFIRPVLRSLGWEYEVQESIAGVNKTPDYALLTSREEWEAIQELKGAPELWEHCAAVGDAKRWKQDLDRSRDGENPSIQITNYLFRSGVRWGILTNGAKWRLYEQDRSRGGGIYYEVDLLSILQSQDPEAFKYFYLFFRKDAFVPVRDEKSFVAIVYEDSERYRTEVGDSLKEAVYDALRHLMNGFFRYPDNQLDPSDAEQLKRMHDLSLVLLYRIIFLLYAEDMDLLPAGTQPYADYSMVRLQKQINSHLRSGARYVSGARGLWHDLLDRFALIDQGLSDNGDRIIPAYNGGLFSCQRYPEIAYERQPEASRWEIGDSYLAEAIDLLAYQRESWDEPGSQTVDYATLGVQHLGAIYEGLLELKPQVASEPMIEQPGKSGKPPVVKEKADVAQPKKVRGQQPREFSTGEIYLVTDRGERKATGSYYTPKYIVDYIVEHTVGELAEEAADEVAERWEEVAEELDISAPEQWPELLAAADQEYEQRKLAEKQRWLLAPYLDLKILDPAMGSGHFLVGASDHLSLAMATDPYLPPVPEAEEADVQAYYKRLVVEHCLYGVDLNPLAVELAKLSLWLHTVSRDKALSFLDHHLRCGNSLIGARLHEDLSRPPPPVGGGESKETVQIPLGFDETLEERDLAAFLDTFRKIVDAPTGDAETERDKDRWFSEMDRQRDRYRQVANLWLAPYFGAEVTADRCSQALEALREGAGSEQWQSLTEQDWFQQAQGVAGERNFFHWELEFPEAFFEVQDGRADWKPEAEQGFNAVIGNPPYVNVVEMYSEYADADKEFFRCRYESAQGAFDAFVIFLELAICLTKRECHSALIIPNKVLSAEYAKGFRSWAPSCAQLVRLCDLSRVPVFESAVYPVIPIFRSNGITEGDRPLVVDVSYAASIEAQHLHLEPLCRFSNDLLLKQDLPWSFAIASGASALRPCLELSTPLESITDVSGAATVTEAYEWKPYLRSLGRSSEIPEGTARFVTSGNIYRYDCTWDSDSVQYIKDAYIRPVLTLDYPPMSPRRIQQSTTPKIIIAGMGLELRAHVSLCPLVAGKSTVVVSPKDQNLFYIAALLNSRITHSVYEALYADLKLDSGYFRFGPPQLGQMPIRIIDNVHLTPNTDKQNLMEECRFKLEAAHHGGLLRVVTNALATHAALHGPAGKPELKEEPYWQEQIAGADPDFPGREDFVHDLLAELAQRMIDLNRKKHQLIEQFETDLRGAAPADLHDDLQRGKHGRSLHKHEACRPFVNEDSHTHHLPETLAWSAEAFEDFLRELVGAVSNLTDFLEVYCRYTDQYRQVTEALEKTDDLIDQIVYALYGLTEEEIAIVEESTQ